MELYVYTILSTQLGILIVSLTFLDKMIHLRNYLYIYAHVDLPIFILGILAMTVKSPLDALATVRARHDRIDLVLTDLHMPEMNGIELQKQIQEECNHMPVISKNPLIEKFYFYV